MSTPTASTERDPQTSAVIAAAIEVHRHLGRGFLEYVYRTPLELELLDRGVPFKREVQYPIVYKNKRTGIVFRVNLVCFGAVIVELKAMKALTGSERAQVINYLRASGLERALLLNFGTPILSIERFVNTARPTRALEITTGPDEVMGTGISTRMESETEVGKRNEDEGEMKMGERRKLGTTTRVGPEKIEGEVKKTVQKMGEQ